MQRLAINWKPNPALLTTPFDSHSVTRNHKRKKTGRGWHHTAAPRIAGQMGQGNNRLPRQHAAQPIVPGSRNRFQKKSHAEVMAGPEPHGE
jgi:hypothetical protein